MVVRQFRGWKRIVAGWLVLSVVSVGAEMLPAHACPRHGAAMASAMLVHASASGHTMVHAKAAAPTGDRPMVHGGHSSHHHSPQDTNSKPCTCPGQCCTPLGTALISAPLTWQAAGHIVPLRSISARAARVSAEDPRLGLPFATAPPRV